MVKYWLPIIIIAGTLESNFFRRGNILKIFSVGRNGNDGIGDVLGKENKNFETLNCGGKPVNQRGSRMARRTMRVFLRFAAIARFDFE